MLCLFGLPSLLYDWIIYYVFFVTSFGTKLVFMKFSTYLSIHIYISLDVFNNVSFEYFQDLVSEQAGSRKSRVRDEEAARWLLASGLRPQRGREVDFGAAVNRMADASS